MSYGIPGYPKELASMVEDSVGERNLSLSVAALMLGIGNLIQDKDLDVLSKDFWARIPRFPGNTRHHFLTENSPGINLEWWCERWLIPRLVSVELNTAAGWSARYTFSEGWTGNTDKDSALSVALNNPSDSRHSNWEATIRTSTSEGPMSNPEYSLPRWGKHHGDQDFLELANSIQAGLEGASCIRVV